MPRFLNARNLLYAGSEKRALPTATPGPPGVFCARFGPFCAALRHILRIYGFEGEARAQGEARLLLLLLLLLR